MDEEAGAFDRGRIIPSSGLTGELGGSLEDQLARAQERLAFYESFDGLIQENIARSGELLRQAMDMRESAIQEIALARQQTAQTIADAERRVGDERERQRTALAALRDELNQLQQHAAGLVGRVADALAELAARGGPANGQAAAFAAEAPSTATGDAPTTDAPLADARRDIDAAPIPAAQGNGAHAALQARDELPALDASSIASGEPSTTTGGQAAWTAPPVAEPTTPETEATPSLSLTRQNAPVGGTGFIDAATVADQTAADSAPPPPASDPTSTLDASAPRPIMVLVHGVPRAAAALSLQRHLAALGHVDAVEAREYAEGVLRLQVLARGPLQLEDIRRWEGGGNLEPVHVLDDVIEVKLPGAGGL